MENLQWVEFHALVYAPIPGFAEDVMQDVYLEFSSRFPSGCAESDIPQVIRNITRDVVQKYRRDIYRKRSDVLRRVGERLACIIEEQTIAPEIDELVHLRECLKKLSPKSREYIELFYFQKMSVSQICQHHNHMNLNMVYKAISRIRRKLGQCIRQMMNGSGD